MSKTWGVKISRELSVGVEMFKKTDMRCLETDEQKDVKKMFINVYYCKGTKR